MKVLFFSPPSGSPISGWLYPLGISYLATSISHMAEVRAYNLFDKEWTNEMEVFVKKTIEEEKPDVVALSFLTLNRIASYKIVNIVKRINPGIKVIMGNIHASSMNRQILNNFPVDAIVMGEGEKTLPELLDAFSNNKDLRNVKGISFKDENGIHVTEKRELIQNLDEIPFPDHDLFSDTIKNKNHACIMSSRGCPSKCQFCSTTIYWGCKWRSRSPKNVVDELEILVNKYKGLETVTFYDDNFTINNRRVMEICDEIVRRGIKIKWKCEGRVHPISEEMLDAMKRAGCYRITYGVESCSQKMLDYMNKGITLDQILNAINLTKKSGIECGMFMLVGVKGESEETIKETIEFIRKNRIDVIESVAALELYPNTESYEIAKQEGFIDDSFWLEDQPVKVYTQHISEKRLREMAKSIVIESIKAKGRLGVLNFAAKLIFLHPRKVLKALFSGGYIKNSLKLLR